MHSGTEMSETDLRRASSFRLKSSTSAAEGGGGAILLFLIANCVD